MAGQTTCPFCNALVAVAEPAPVVGRLACPRCGESFPLGNRQKAGDSDIDKLTPTPSPAPAAGPVVAGRPVVAPRSRSRAWPIAVVALAVGAAGIGLALSRSKDHPTAAEPVAPDGPVAPWELPALAYLPRESDAIVGLDLRQVRQEAVPGGRAREREALVALGLPESALAAFERATGFGLTAVDDAVLGARFNPLGFVLVLHARQPLPPGDPGSKGNNRVFHRNGRHLTEVRVDPLLSLFLWSPNPHYALLALSPDDFEGMPIEPPAGPAPVPEKLLGLMQARVSRQAAAWLAARSENWNEALGPLFLLPSLRGKQTPRATLQQLRSVAASAEYGQNPVFRVQIEAKTEEAAGRWRQQWGERARAGAGSVTVGETGPWVSVEAPLNAADVRRALNVLLAPGEK